MIDGLLRQMKFQEEQGGGGRFVDPVAVLQESLGRSLTREELAKIQGDAIRERGAEEFREMAAMKGPKTRMTEWDHEVVSGTFERIPDSFLWFDLHWAIDKAKLLTRVKEWNDALEQYCDDVGLTGARRKAVVELHTASPYAPCANPACDKVETKVKEYQRCARCKEIGYCSRACQAAHWRKEHKMTCSGSSNVK